MTYPLAPGWKEPTTSKDAAEAIKPSAERIRDMILRQLAISPLSTDECAERLGLSVLSVRPRFSELSKTGWIEKHGKTRNKSGMTATIWRLKNANK